jgi:hypothetical protein
MHVSSWRARRRQELGPRQLVFFLLDPDVERASGRDVNRPREPERESQLILQACMHACVILQEEDF